MNKIEEEEKEEKEKKILHGMKWKKEGQWKGLKRRKECRLMNKEKKEEIKNKKFL